MPVKQSHRADNEILYASKCGLDRQFEFLTAGRRYRVTRQCIEFDKHVHPPGEQWLFGGTSFQPSDDSRSFFVSADGGEERQIRRRDALEDQGDFLRQLETYLSPLDETLELNSATREVPSSAIGIVAMVALPDPAPEPVGKILGAALQPDARGVAKFAVTFAQGPFGKAGLRYYKELGPGILILDARPDSRLSATNVDLRKYRRKTMYGKCSQTHLGGSEGKYSDGFTPAPGIKMTFQFTTKKQRLYCLVVDSARAVERSNQIES
jgi:hypothetical protein